VIENEILNIEFPHQVQGLESMDKYCLRFWLIGWATVRGWKWSYRNWETHCLTKQGVDVLIKLSVIGLVLVAGSREVRIETRA
jgi:hypothetical protein